MNVEASDSRFAVEPAGAWPMRAGTAVAITVLLAASAVFRFLWLDRLPGFNGDEGWYGVQVQRWLDGRSWSGLTPSSLPINPFLFLTEAALLRFLEPSGWTLRLPIAVWASVGLAVAGWFHAWVFRDRLEGLLVLVLSACLPAHLAYSRFCWDSSFGLVSLPLVLYGTLRLASGSAGGGAWTVFLVGAILSVWAHATNALFVAACLMVLGWNVSERWRLWLWRDRRRRRAALALALCAVAVSLAWQWRLALWFFARGDRYMVEQYGTNWRGIVAAADMVTGTRIYEYLSGVPRSGWVVVLNGLFCVVVAGAVVVLYRSRTRADGALAALMVMVLIGIVLVSRRLRLGELSYERYLLYLIPLSVAGLVRAVAVWSLHGRPWRRGFAAWLALGLPGVFLVQFWWGYFQPQRGQWHVASVHGTQYQTFRTGAAEPKRAAARRMLGRAGDAAEFIAFVEDWSLRWPVEYFLDGRGEVRDGAVRFHETGRRLFVIGYAGSKYSARAVREANGRGWRVTTDVFRDPLEFPILVLLSFEEPETGDGHSD